MQKDPELPKLSKLGNRSLIACFVVVVEVVVGGGVGEEGEE